MKLSVFTDEVCRQDPGRALALTAGWGLKHAELRTVRTGRFPLVPDAEIEEFGRQLRGEGLALSGVSPGFFKCPVDDPQVRPLLERELPRACEWARRLGSDLVSCFAFARQEQEEPPAQVIDYLGEMARLAGQQGCRLALENEAVCWGGTGLEAIQLIEQTGATNLSLCWDPGNAARAGSPRPFPDEYRQFAQQVSHLHMKNFDPQAGRWSLMEQGVVDWPGQLAALAAKGYQGFIIVETHLNISPDAFALASPDLSALESNTRRNLEFVRACLPDVL
ncbi:MAG: sugar phosphate isomerase/epimerase [Candidatus Handelsmanbacteria bacterium]|nr:sugar phosphate isomerase/epimerase [Candidatus Handelsmanbacteria bacterium]